MFGEPGTDDPPLWRYLFPAGAVFTRDATDASRTASSSSETVLIVGRDDPVPSAFESLDELVVLGGKLMKAHLPDVGLPYVRDYAVIPSAMRTRWLVPLDNGSVALGAFAMHPPYRSGARLKYGLARAAARLQLPGWYRDRVRIAHRRPPSLESRVREIVGPSLFRLGFSGGNPGAHRKPVFVGLRPNGGTLAFGKLAMSAGHEERLRNEARALEHFGRPSWPHGAVAPKLLFRGDIEGRYCVLASPLGGSRGSTRLSLRHRNFLASLQGRELRTAGSTEFIRALWDRQAAVGHFPESVATWRLLDVLGDTPIPGAMTHGDFAPWNTRLVDGSVMAFDWEWWCADGLPFIDELHYALQSGFLLRNWDARRAFRYLEDHASRLPLGVAAHHVRALAGIGIVDYLLRMVEDGYSESRPLHRNYQMLLSRVLSSI